MSSYTPTSTKSLFSTFPAVYHVDAQDEPEENKPPIDEPTEQKSMWKPGGYTPTRVSWHTVRGRLKSYLA